MCLRVKYRGCAHERERERERESVREYIKRSKVKCAMGR